MGPVAGDEISPLPEELTADLHGNQGAQAPRHSHQPWIQDRTREKIAFGREKEGENEKKHPYHYKTLGDPHPGTGDTIQPAEADQTKKTLKDDAHEEKPYIYKEKDKDKGRDAGPHLIGQDEKEPLRKGAEKTYGHTESGHEPDEGRDGSAEPCPKATDEGDRNDNAYQDVEPVSVPGKGAMEGLKIHGFERFDPWLVVKKAVGLDGCRIQAGLEKPLIFLDAGSPGVLWDHNGFFVYHNDTGKGKRKDGPVPAPKPFTRAGGHADRQYGGVRLAGDHHSAFLGDTGRSSGSVGHNPHMEPPVPHCRCQFHHRLGPTLESGSEDRHLTVSLDVAGDQASVSAPAHHDGRRAFPKVIECIYEGGMPKGDDGCLPPFMKGGESFLVHHAGPAGGEPEIDEGEGHAREESQVRPSE